MLSVLYILLCAALTPYLVMQLWLAVAARRRPPVRERGGEPLPRVTVQLPLYNERYVAERLLASVGELDYPRELLEIQILDDSTDDTPEIVERAIASLPRGTVAVHLRRDRRTGFKAGALAAGQAVATGELMAVLDADFVPPTDFLRRALPPFADPAVGAVQSRWTHLNRDQNLLTRLQALLLDVHFRVDQAGRHASGSFVNFNGSAGIWRAHAIEDAGGWRADTLTEDVDLSYRAQLRGWRIVYVDAFETPAELPADVRAFRFQQFRWMKGMTQNAVRLVPALVRSRQPLAVKLHAIGHLLEPSNYVAMAAVIVLTPVLAARVVAHEASALVVLNPLWLVNVLLLGPIYYLPRAASYRTPSAVLRFVGLWLAFMALSTGIALHNGLAVLDGASGRKSSFRRTPKTGSASRSSSSYRVRGIDPILPLELVLACYLAAGTVYVASRGGAYLMWVPLLAIVGLTGMFAMFAGQAIGRPRAHRRTGSLEGAA